MTVHPQIRSGGFQLRVSMRLVICALASLAIAASQGSAPSTAVIAPIDPTTCSGIYPHTAVTNTHYEVGIGGIIKRGDVLYYMTYGPHITAGGSDKLYSLNTNTLERTTYLLYPGNTDANRYRDTKLGIDVIGAAYIDNAETIRYLPVTKPGELRGRITGTAAHLSDPNKLYYMTMEEGLYEVDFSNVKEPRIATLRQDGNYGGSKNLPGVHGKGLCTAQGHLFFTNNGQGEGFGGGLLEWDGTGDPELQSSWTLVDTAAQYTEVTTRRGPQDMDPGSTDAVWATGWDEASMFINMRDATSAQWTKFRLPISSYTHGHPSGWYTEWPRIRDVGLEGGHLMSHHGMMYLLPEEFSTDKYGGLTPLATHLKMIVDFVEDGDRIVFAANDASKFDNDLVAKANSNIMFLNKTDLPNYGGTPSGFGGVWVNDSVSAGIPSDAFLISGFADRVLHLAHSDVGPIEFTIEIDPNSTGSWTTHKTISVAGSEGGTGYGYYVLPYDLRAQWLRIVPDSNTTATAYMHFSNEYLAVDDQLTASLSKPGAPVARSQGVIRSQDGSDFKLEFAADILDAAGHFVDTNYYVAQLNPTTFQLELVAIDDPNAENCLRAEAAPKQDYGVDNASVFVDSDGTRYRLPKGDATFDGPTASGWRRGVREVVTERELMNIHGTFYELPRDFPGGGIRRIRPITTHNLNIFDFASWRGMLVLSGNDVGAAKDSHYVPSKDGLTGLWFGNVDDLWKFGAPKGVGGPWKDSAVSAGVASDPYLMTGFREKTMQLSHNVPSTVVFTVEVDFLGTDQWHVYDTFSVKPGEVLTHKFDEGFQAHWVRLTADTSTTATAWFIYGAWP